MITQTRRSTRTIPARMQAVRLHTAGGPAGIVYEAVPTPRPLAGEALVRVYAASITRDELDWPVNRLPAIPSYELSGVVAKLGTDALGFKAGQAVYALGPFNRDGAAAEYVAVPISCLAPKPELLTHAESASIPLAALTAWQGLFEYGHLERGQRVLIHGATGGVGSLAVQLARLRGAHIIGTVSSVHAEAARKLGMDQVVDYAAGPFEASVGEVDLVFDTAGGERLQRSASIIRPGGRLVSVASEPPQELATQRGITASYFVVEPNGAQLGEIGRLIDDHRLKPVIDQVFPLAEARQAFQRSLSRHPAGKVVLRVVED